MTRLELVGQNVGRAARQSRTGFAPLSRVDFYLVNLAACSLAQ